MDTTIDRALERAAAVIAEADALLIGAGAGMGVDSGLPDFRGPQGFWRAYPPYAQLRLEFAAVANPRWFATDPPFAWGFYGHRLNLYRRTQPHDGFAILRQWAERKAAGAFVVTSNVDGHFQRAGFTVERVLEAHGSIHWMQCTRSCGVGVFSAAPQEVEVDETTFRARDPLPACRGCGALARPNILMFGDWDWDPERSVAPSEGLGAWLSSVDRGGARLAIVECGAGRAVPTIRQMCERAASSARATLVRVNPRDPEVPSGHVSLPLGARAALTALDAVVSAQPG